MKAQESPHWSVDPQTYVESWGTTNPLSLKDINPDIFDNTGRPVKEFEDPNPAGVPFVKKAFAQPGSRRGKETNHSAYLAVAPDLRVSLGILSVLYSRILGHRRSNPTLEDHSQVLNAGIMLAAWYVLKADNPMKNGEVPPEIAGVAKICRGLAVPFQRIEDSEVENRYGRSENTAPDTSFMKGPEAFYQFAEEKSILINSQDMACPASRDVIIRGARVMFGEEAVGAAEAEALLGLSAKEIERIKDLGTYFRISTREVLAYQGASLGIDPLRAKLYEAEGVTSPLDLKTDIGKHFRKQEALTMKNLTYAQRLANQALGRRMPSRSVEPNDIPGGPSFTIIKKGFTVT